jgi:hypothetical protein
MQCIFLRRSQNCITDVLLTGELFEDSWEVDGATSKKYCYTEEFRGCPRYVSTIQFAKAKKE